ncbi:MAG: NAD-dependent malic enzyme [Gammaproteobacteria bacterium]|jgi:malic enzyme
MEEFSLERTPEGDQLTVPYRGPALLRFPLYNKGIGFDPEERERFGLLGLLPSRYNDIDTQAERIYKSICFEDDPVRRNISLGALQDRNEHLYYKVLSLHLKELMPIVYTPTVGKASQFYSRVFRRARGIWITPEHKGRVAEILAGAAPFSGVRLMVVTDNESILGIGDQGAGGMAISVGKLALYCVGAGIHPARTLPISLDVGTDNESLLEDPLYIGWRHRRVRGDRYEELVDEFVQAVQSVFPDALIQWEDFRKDNALRILDRYRDEIPSFNDDIQGTGAVALACVLSAGRLTGRSLRDSRILIYGAGAAGLGIARQLRDRLELEGLSGADLQRAVLVMDSRGVITAARESLDHYKQELAWPPELAQALHLTEQASGSLLSVVEQYKPNVLIGASGQGGAFNEAVVRTMDAAVDTPVILPLSNPTSISEAEPENILRWTEGRALLATGSPFDDVPMHGGPRRVGQANNVFVFPGLGLGTIVSGAARITDGMISASAAALADSLNDDERNERCLMPRVARLWDVCGTVALAVAMQAVEDGVAEQTEEAEMRVRIDAYRWRPAYPAFVEARKSR